MNEKKFCKFCGEQINKESIVCPKCGRQLKYIDNKQENNEINSNETKSKFYEQLWFMWIMLIFCAPVGILFMWKFHPQIEKKVKIILTIIFSVIFLLVVINRITADNNNIVNEKEDNNYNNNDKKNTNTIGLDEVFIFDYLKISIGSDYSIDTYYNKYSDNNGKEYIKLPINIKNIKDETHSLNRFYYKVFGSQGIEIDNLNIIFRNDSIDYAGELKSGASYIKYLYIIYDGDGTYSIEFNNWRSKKEVEFNIVK